MEMEAYPPVYRSLSSTDFLNRFSGCDWPKLACTTFASDKVIKHAGLGNMPISKKYFLQLFSHLGRSCGRQLLAT